MPGWRKLLSDNRILSGKQNANGVGRSAFQQDADRIIFCSHFRRLQDKTQVHPCASTDYVRRRLTHSLEVSSVARSLGAGVGERLKVKYVKIGKLEEAASQIGQITAAAALAHDIGNPPFGHVGEAAIQEWFQRNNTKPLFQQLTEHEKSDFLNFEGNAQGFRILTRLANNGNGLKLTAATLGAFMKYPSSSMATAKNAYIGQKKNGFFADDENSFLSLASTLNLNKITDGAWQRHPLAFLVEAADDICYRIIDIEDGWKMRRISLDETEQCLTAFLPANVSYTREKNQDSKNVGWLRAKAINSLAQATMVAFLDNEKALRNGRFTQDLISCTPLAKAMECAKVLAVDKIFEWERIQLAELAGIKMINRLLDDLVDAIEHPKSSMGKRAFKVLEPLSKDAKDYYKLLAVTDHISGMTDSFLINSFERFSGSRID